MWKDSQPWGQQHSSPRDVNTVWEEPQRLSEKLPALIWILNIIHWSGRAAGQKFKKASGKRRVLAGTVAVYLWIDHFCKQIIIRHYSQSGTDQYAPQAAPSPHAPPVSLSPKINSWMRHLSGIVGELCPVDSPRGWLDRIRQDEQRRASRQACES